MSQTPNAKLCSRTRMHVYLAAALPVRTKTRIGKSSDGTVMSCIPCERNVASGRLAGFLIGSDVNKSLCCGLVLIFSV